MITSHIPKLFILLAKEGFVDNDIIYEDNTEIKIACKKIVSKYKTLDSRVKHITQELVDRNYTYSQEDEICCREFMRGYFIGLQEKICQ